MSNRGKTTADLREMLFSVIEEVRAGKISNAQARAISEAAEKIIETADLELRYSAMCSRLDKDGQEISPGKILLTDGTP